jgi:hypothetical protein
LREQLLLKVADNETKGVRHCSAAIDKAASPRAEYRGVDIGKLSAELGPGYLDKLFKCWV